ncbi:MAG: acyl-CoA dehydrogenase family protein [Planctomycetes bacterium]|nr:acyl-CoA dehydrogenase family protein [Planctomycetota bacterium]
MHPQATPPTDPGFLRSMFLGELRRELWFPFPARPADETEVTNQTVAAVASFARTAIDARKIDDDRRISGETLRGLRELGLLGMIVPTEYGGAGFGSTAYCRVIEELASHCASCAATVGAHQSIGLKGILLFGNAAQKLTFLPRLASGESLAAFTLTEPGAGSDAQSISTRARRDGGDWILDGAKAWVTNGGIADLYTVFARTSETADAGGGKLTCFLVPRSTPGVSIGKEEDKMGLRGSSTTPVYFESARVPDANRLGEVGRGFKVAMEILNSGRHGLAAGCLGAGRAALKDATEHAKSRRQFGRPIIEFPLVAEMLFDARADLYAIESGCHWVAGRIDDGAADVSLEAAICKIYATESLWRIVNDSLQIAGGSGFVRDFPYERRVRDARVNLIFEGTNQILRLYVALQGLRAPGERLRRLSTALRNPFKHFGDLGEAGLARMRRPATAGFPPHWNPWLASAAASAVDSTHAFGRVAEAALRRHRDQITGRQLTLAHLCDAATALFMQSAIVSRLGASAVVAERDEIIARRALARHESSFRSALRAIESDAEDRLLRDMTTDFGAK